jgi:hypothetical protein
MQMGLKVGEIAGTALDYATNFRDHPWIPTTWFVAFFYGASWLLSKLGEIVGSGFQALCEGIGSLVGRIRGKGKAKPAPSETPELQKLIDDDKKQLAAFQSERDALQKQKAAGNFQAWQQHRLDVVTSEIQRLNDEIAYYEAQKTASTAPGSPATPPPATTTPPPATTTPPPATTTPPTGNKPPPPKPTSPGGSNASPSRVGSSTLPPPPAPSRPLIIR